MQYYRRDLRRASRVATREPPSLPMGEGYTSGCSRRHRQCMGLPPSSRPGTCWRVLRYVFAAPRTVTQGRYSLLVR